MFRASCISLQGRIWGLSTTVIRTRLHIYYYIPSTQRNFTLPLPCQADGATQILYSSQHAKLPHKTRLSVTIMWLRIIRGKVEPLKDNDKPSWNVPLPWWPTLATQRQVTQADWHSNTRTQKIGNMEIYWQRGRGTRGNWDIGTDGHRQTDIRTQGHGESGTRTYTIKNAEGH